MVVDTIREAKAGSGPIVCGTSTSCAIRKREFTITCRSWSFSCAAALGHWERVDSYQLAGTEWCSCTIAQCPLVLRSPIVKRNGSWTLSPLFSVPEHRISADTKATS